MLGQSFLAVVDDGVHDIQLNNISIYRCLIRAKLETTVSNVISQHTVEHVAVQQRYEGERILMENYPLKNTYEGGYYRSNYPD